MLTAPESVSAKMEDPAPSKKQNLYLCRNSLKYFLIKCSRYYTTFTIRTIDFFQVRVKCLMRALLKKKSMVIDCALGRWIVFAV